MTDIDTLLDDEDRVLIAIVRYAVKHERRGDPLKDFISGSDIIEALRILDRIGKAMGIKPKWGNE